MTASRDTGVNYSTPLDTKNISFCILLVKISCAAEQQREAIKKQQNYSYKYDFVFWHLMVGALFFSTLPLAH